MRVGIGQINPHVGAMQKNADAILGAIAEARAEGCDLVVFPELAVCGYIPLDLMWKPGFVAACERAIDRIREATRGITVIVGSITSQPAQEGINRFDLSSISDGAATCLHNTAYLLKDGVTAGMVHKTHLPCYDIYNEKRYFSPAPGVEVHPICGTTCGINICEDLWIDDGPTELQASLGAEWIINISASPYYTGKPAIRHRLAVKRASQNGVGVVYVNLVGGQDDVVFDGGSFVVNPDGRLVFQAPRVKEGLFCVDLDLAKPVPAPAGDPVTEVRDILTLGIRDYVTKNGFSSVLLGLSGGIDSALVAALATDALGPETVTGIFMPSMFSSDESREDARATAEGLGIHYLEISIAELHETLRAALPQLPGGLVDENIQPRLRGIVLMAMANQRHALVLAPGNKSEIAVGYSTLYGDTVGALAPIADLYKDDVVRLTRLYGSRIPQRVITKPPTAELRPDQRDDEDLPPYDVLDPILRALIETGASRQQLVARGFAEPLVDDVIRRYYVNEYKRRQLPPGIKITPKAFGIGRRMPITNGYRD